jgi:hypothetical protein
MANTPRLGREAARKRYVVGFAFNPSETRVALIQKLRAPEGAEDMIETLNGVGGEVLPREGYGQGMAREFFQEAGVVVADWRVFCIIDGPSYRLWCFRATLGRNEWRSLRCGDNSKTDERLGRYRARNLPNNVFDDVRFLVALAISKEYVVKIDRRGI